MATDATGTPTSLGIPTYNVNVDAPSGNGFNAAMAEIDTLLQGRAPLASPAFTGTPTSTTPPPGDNTTKIATTAFVEAALGIVPSGAMMQYAGVSAPLGWLIADGSAISRTTYAALFAAIGTTYGAGDGSTTFNIPNTKGRVLVGLNSTGTFTALGGAGGEESHTLSAAEMPSHNHSASASSSSTFSGNDMGSHNHYSVDYSGVTMTWNSEGGSSGNSVINNIGKSSAGAADGYTGASGYTGSGTPMTSYTDIGTPSGSVSTSTSVTVNANGGGGAHNNIQPYVVINHIIKT